jgi:hypothetical protein
MTVWASDATDDGVKSTESGTETIETIGSAEYVKTDIYKMVLPTSSGMSLTVDPQGLSTLQAGQSKTDAELAGDAGKIFTNVASVANQGARPVKVTAKMKLESDDATTVTSDTDVEKDGTTANNIYAYVVPSGVDTKDASGYLASGNGYVLSSTEVELNFVVPAATYKFTKTADGNTTKTEYVRDETVAEHGTALKVDGLVNKNADWSGFVKSGDAEADKEITLTTVFEFAYQDSTSTDKAEASTLVPFLMSGATGTKVALPITSDTTKSIAINFTLSDTAATSDAAEVKKEDKDVVGAIEFTSPNESKGTTTVPAAALTQTPAASTYKKDAYQVTYNAAHDGGTLVIYAKQLATWGKVAASTYKFGGYGQYTVKIDGESYTFTITDPAN